MPDSTHLTVGGADVVLRDSGGEGPLVLLIHGWCADGVLNFAPVFEPLEQAGYRAVSLDLPGCGATKDNQRFSLGRCAEVAGMILEEMTDEPAIIVGFSMGGAVAQLLARSHPELVQGLVFVATAAHLASHQFSRSEVNAVSHLFDLPASIADKVSSLPLLSGRGDGEHGGMSAHMSWWLRRGHLRDSLEAGRELSCFDSSLWVGSLGIPSVSVITTGDHLVGLSAQRELAALSGAGSIEVDAGHLLVTEERFGGILVEATQQLSDVCESGADSRSYD